MRLSSSCFFLFGIDARRRWTENVIGFRICVRYWGIKRAKKQPISTKAQLKCLVRDSIPDEKLFVTLDIKVVSR